MDYCVKQVLINAQYPIKCMDNGKLTTVDSYFPNVLLRSEAASALQKILSKIMAGKEIVPVSGYRSMKEQSAIYQNSLRANREAFTNQFVSLPGHSEHQTGLAIDLGQNQKKIDFIRPNFPYEGICGDFRKVTPDFGFVERYPKEKETITGIAHEPWHFRYVGTPHAEIMREHHFCLEEYIDFLKRFSQDQPYTFYKDSQEIQIFYLKADTESVSLEVAEDGSLSVSGNNVDGYIITEWRG